MRCYTFIRMDIPIQHQITQACHSAIQAGAEFLSPEQIPYLITLQAKDQEHLFQIKEFLEYCNIRYYMFFEPDNNMGYSSITTEPLNKEQSKKLSNFKLWKY